MGQLLKHAAMKDALTQSRKEEFVYGMRQLIKLVVMKDAQNNAVNGRVCRRHGARPTCKKWNNAVLHAFRWYVTQARLVLLPAPCTCTLYDSCPEESE